MRLSFSFHARMSIVIGVSFTCMAVLCAGIFLCAFLEQPLWLILCLAALVSFACAWIVVHQINQEVKDGVFVWVCCERPLDETPLLPQ